MIKGSGSEGIRCRNYSAINGCTQLGGEFSILWLVMVNVVSGVWIVLGRFPLHDVVNNQREPGQCRCTCRVLVLVISISAVNSLYGVNKMRLVLVLSRVVVSGCLIDVKWAIVEISLSII